MSVFCVDGAEDGGWAGMPSHGLDSGGRVRKRVSAGWQGPLEVAQPKGGQLLPHPTRADPAIGLAILHPASTHTGLIGSATPHLPSKGAAPTKTGPLQLAYDLGPRAVWDIARQPGPIACGRPFQSAPFTGTHKIA